MPWDWDHFFENIIDLQSFDKSIDDKTDYNDENIQSVFLDSKDIPSDLIYSPWSYNFFNLSCKESTISIDKMYLLRFLNDYKSKLVFNSGAPITKYIGYEFFLNLNLSRDISSGKTNYKSQLKNLLETVIKYGTSMEGKELIHSKNDLEEYLKKNLSGFSSLDKELA